ncbi:MAG: SUMF1/EgtB/PvdO family nonheme iron enzyme [Acidobacteria bacterium]|nr:SUMF1/EgtB/PvdO family nonheme iron enzyme [Acidobacteriota bacterium]
MSEPLRDAEVRQDLMVRLAEARARTDELIGLLRPDALYDRPIPERHRSIFYLGHFEAFDWNLVCRGAFGSEPFHDSFDQLFAFGIDPVGGDLPADTPSDWPSIPEIEEYNRTVRESVDECLRDFSLSAPSHPALEGGAIFHLAIEHRLMHAETFAYLLHQMPLSKKILQPGSPRPAVPSPAPCVVEIAAGSATLGLVRQESFDFGWDNEFDPQSVDVGAFRIDAQNVTNGDFLKFIGSGAYDDRALWTRPDWEWKTSQEITHPGFWLLQGEDWYWRTMFAEIPLPLDWPAYASHAEASAYAHWRGKALPTEAQFHRAAYGTHEGRERAYPWGDEAPGVCHGNFNFQLRDPTSVGAYPAGRSGFGLDDLVGNGWEWTSTLFEPFSGFQVFPLYPRYSANFFDGKHYVAKGGSPFTAACMLRRSFRNWFQPHYPFVYAAFRCVER